MVWKKLVTLFAGVNLKNDESTALRTGPAVVATVILRKLHTFMPPCRQSVGVCLLGTHTFLKPKNHPSGRFRNLEPQANLEGPHVMGKPAHCDATGGNQGEERKGNGSQPSSIGDGDFMAAGGDSMCLGLL